MLILISLTSLCIDLFFNSYYMPCDNYCIENCINKKNKNNNES